MLPVRKGLTLKLLSGRGSKIKLQKEISANPEAANLDSIENEYIPGPGLQTPFDVSFYSVLIIILQMVEFPMLNPSAGGAFIEGWVQVKGESTKALAIISLYLTFYNV